MNTDPSDVLKFSSDPIVALIPTPAERYDYPSRRRERSEWQNTVDDVTEPYRTKFRKSAADSMTLDMQRFACAMAANYIRYLELPEEEHPRISDVYVMWPDNQAFLRDYAEWYERRRIPVGQQIRIDHDLRPEKYSGRPLTIQFSYKAWTGANEPLFQYSVRLDELNGAADPLDYATVATAILNLVNRASDAWSNTPNTCKRVFISNWVDAERLAHQLTLAKPGLADLCTTAIYNIPPGVKPVIQEVLYVGGCVFARRERTLYENPSSEWRISVYPNC